MSIEYSTIYISCQVQSHCLACNSPGFNCQHYKNFKFLPATGIRTVGGTEPHLLSSAPKYSWIESQNPQRLYCEGICAIDSNSSGKSDGPFGAF